MSNEPIDAYITLVFRMDHIITKQELYECYDGNLVKCISEQLNNEGLIGCVDIDNFFVVGASEVIKKDNK